MFGIATREKTKAVFQQMIYSGGASSVVLWSWD
jgi:hypothetical protein